MWGEVESRREDKGDLEFTGLQVETQSSSWYLAWGFSIEPPIIQRETQNSIKHKDMDQGKIFI